VTDIATTAAIERYLDLRSTPERVWRALTDPAELAAWFGQRADFRAEVGYDGWMEWDGHGRYAMRVEEAVAPVRLVIRWMNEAGVALDPARSTLLEWDLAPNAAGGTRLHLRESGLRGPDARAGNVVGWIGEFSDLLVFLADERWQAGIRRTVNLRSPIERVWRAFADPAEFGAWWGGTDPVELRAGVEGWWVWPSEGGRFAVRIEAVEPPTYLAWTWTPVPDVPIAEAPELLHTEWALEARPDGGTDLHLLETGFTGPDNHRLNDGGWDADVIPALRRVLGEAEA
jgi:uncharacterized protein YndB with AHSA1/START domain